MVLDSGEWVELLVVPRLYADDPLEEEKELPPHTSTSHLKGKRTLSPSYTQRPSASKRPRIGRSSSRPSPKLFASTADSHPAGHRFDQDLLILRCRPCNIQTATHVSKDLRELWAQSANKRASLSQLPLPKEWTMVYGEKVFDRTTGLRGVVGALEKDRILLLHEEDVGTPGDNEMGWILRVNALKDFDDYEVVEVPVPGGQILQGWVVFQGDKKGWLVEVMIIQELESMLTTEVPSLFFIYLAYANFIAATIDTPKRV